MFGTLCQFICGDAPYRNVWYTMPVCMWWCTISKCLVHYTGYYVVVHHIEMFGTLCRLACGGAPYRNISHPKGGE